MAIFAVIRQIYCKAVVLPNTLNACLHPADGLRGNVVFCGDLLQGSVLLYTTEASIAARREIDRNTPPPVGLLQNNPNQIKQQHSRKVRD